MSNIGINIKHLRQKKGLNQKDLGELIGVSQTSIAHYEAGTREPTIDTLKSLAGIFETTTDSIIGLSNHKVNISKEKKRVQDLKEILLKALLEKNDVLLIETFKQDIIGTFSIEIIIEDIIKSVLYKIGDLWNEGHISEADEHYASNQMRKIINYISVGNASIIKSSVAISMSIGSEKHTLGIELINMYLETLGIKTIYLGNDVPFRNFDNLVSRFTPKFIFLSITLEENINHMMALIDYINEKMGETFKLVIGGQGVNSLPKIDYPNVYVVKNLKELREII